MKPNVTYPLGLTLQQQCQLLHILRHKMHKRAEFSGPILSAFDAVNVEPEPGSSAVFVDLSGLQLQTIVTEIAHHVESSNGPPCECDGLAAAIMTAVELASPKEGAA